MKLETLFKNKLATETRTCSIYAFELWRDECGWSVNDGWRLARDADLQYILKVARDRWGVFKANYMPKARISDITFEGDENTIYVECNHTSFLELRFND
jgi:hypothetical protein